MHRRVRTDTRSDETKQRDREAAHDEHEAMKRKAFDVVPDTPDAGHGDASDVAGSRKP